MQEVLYNKRYERMNEELSKDEERFLERPFECGECKRPVRYLYTEVVGKTMTSYKMCEECPVLQHKLQGQTLFEGDTGKDTSLCCGGCGVTLEDVKQGGNLGCSLCYDVFKDEIIHELIQLEKIPIAFRNGNTNRLHFGRTAEKIHGASVSLKLSTLQQALHDTLGREDYEQAAYLRDQIKALTENEGKKKE